MRLSAASNRNPLDLIERDLIAGAIVQLGGARAFMRRHGLRVFQSAAGFEIGGNAGGAKGMAANLGPRAEVGGAALDHAVGVDAVHGFIRQRAGAASGGAEQGGLPDVADVGGLDIGVEIGFESVMRRHLMVLATFLVGMSLNWVCFNLGASWHWVALYVDRRHQT